MMMNMKALLPRLLFTASVVAAALLSPPAVSGQNQKESYTGFAINMNSAKDGGRGFHDRPMVHGRRARAAAVHPQRGKGQLQGERQAAEGAAEDAQGRLHPHPEHARVGSALRASERAG